MPFASALSEHPDPRQAAGEVIGAILDRGLPSPDLVVLFVSGSHVREVEGVAHTVYSLLEPSHLVGATASSVVGDSREVEDRPAVSLWAGWFSAPVEVVRLDAVRTGDGTAIVGLDAADVDAADAVLLLAEPTSFPTDDLLARWRVGGSGTATPVFGGIASAGFHPGANGIVVDDDIYTDGAVAVLFPPGAVGISTVVSQGCRPVGDPLTVTEAEGNVVRRIAGAPAFERLTELIVGMPEEDRELARKGLHLGRVIDEHKLDFERGDFLVRNLVGADQATGSIAVNDVIELGATVQFQVRDADSADDDLRALLTGRDADATLVFTCNGRGTHLFGEADHDAEVVAGYLGDPATAGMFCAGEIGSIGGKPFLHGFTASIALFRDLDAG